MNDVINKKIENKYFSLISDRLTDLLKVLL